MTAALTIAVLFALSSIIVRVAATIMRHTGLPQNIARLQCISALSGTGFTTRESEMIVNYPIRRKVLVALMILGNLGMASIATTFIVAFVVTDKETGAIVTQVLAFALAIGITLIVMSNKTLDRWMCSLVSRFLVRTKTFSERRYQRVLQLDDGYSIAEHVIAGSTHKTLQELPLSELSLVALAVRVGNTHKLQQIEEAQTVESGDTLICYGRDDGHDELQAALYSCHTTNNAASEP